jgi:hypothetical protein
MKKVLITINSCSDCPFHTFDADEKHKWGKHWCEKLDTELENPKVIHTECPMPEVKS